MQSRNILLGFLLLVICYSCSNPEREKKDKSLNDFEKKFYNGIGFGPVSNVVIDPVINEEWVKSGDSLFSVKCVSCHNLTDVRKIGPGLKGITERRRPEWIMNQIINPMENTQKDSLAKELLSIYLAQMVSMDLSVEQARQMLEFFRRQDSVK